MLPWKRCICECVVERTCHFLPRASCQTQKASGAPECRPCGRPSATVNLMTCGCSAGGGVSWNAGCAAGATAVPGAGDAGVGDAGVGDAGVGDAGVGDAGVGDAGAGDAGAGAE